MKRAGVEIVGGRPYVHVHIQTMTFDLYKELLQELADILDDLEDMGHKELFNVTNTEKIKVPELFGFEVVAEVAPGLTLLRMDI